MDKEDPSEKIGVDSPVDNPDGNAAPDHKEGGEKNPEEQESAETTLTELPKARDTDLDSLKIGSPVGEEHQELEEENLMEQQLTGTTGTEVLEEREPESHIDKHQVDPSCYSVAENEADTHKTTEDRQIDENSSEVKHSNSSPPQDDVYTHNNKEEGQGDEFSSEANKEFAPPEKLETEFFDREHVGSVTDIRSLNLTEKESEKVGEKGQDTINNKEGLNLSVDSENLEGTGKNVETTEIEEEREPIVDGTEIQGMEADRSLYALSLENDSETQGSAWPEKAVAIKNFVREKSVVAVSSVLRRLSGKGDDGRDSNEEDGMKSSDADSKEIPNSPQVTEAQEDSQKTEERSGWNPLSLIGISFDSGLGSKADPMEENNKFSEPIPMKGRIILYTKLGCQDCKEARLFLHLKRLRYVEINIDVYPGRKLELDKLPGSPAVPRVYFNEVLIGGLGELKDLEESGKLMEKIEYLIAEAPSIEAPLPPLSGEDDVSSSGTIDELFVTVRKMKNHIVVKDRFYRMRRFTNTFLGSEAVDFLSEDQYLEREEAIEFGRKLGSDLFFQHVLGENVLEDGNHVYRFLDDDPLISQCQNIPRGIIEVKPKPIADISSRLRILCYAIFEAYTSEDGKHVDYRSIHGSEEFARYLRIVEELQRVDLQEMPREEKLVFFINLYNMMVIHAILVWGHAAGALERRRFFGEFRYVIGGCAYSLSAIENGILRGNQRPPYYLTRPFGLKDKRLMVALPNAEPLSHFALVYGTRSSPALRCYSPGDIDKELKEAASNFLRSEGLIVDLNAKIASVNKILRWYSADFGKNEGEVLKHAANYLEPEVSQAMLELLDTSQLKVVYQPYDWGLNH